MLEVMYQTCSRDDVSSRNTKKRDEITMRSRVFLNEIQGVWIVDETVSQVFDINYLLDQNETNE